MSCNCDELQGQIKACLPSLRARTLIEAARKRSVSDEAKATQAISKSGEHLLSPPLAPRGANLASR